MLSGNNLIVFYYLDVSEICTELVGVALLEGEDYCRQNFTNSVHGQTVFVNCQLWYHINFKRKYVYLMYGTLPNMFIILCQNLYV